VILQPESINVCSVVCICKDENKAQAPASRMKFKRKSRVWSPICERVDAKLTLPDGPGVAEVLSLNFCCRCDSSKSTILPILLFVNMSFLSELHDGIISLKAVTESFEMPQEVNSKCSSSGRDGRDEIIAFRIFFIYLILYPFVYNKNKYRII
jgi:hypothetical protein